MGAEPVTPLWLCSLKQVPAPLWASVSPPVKSETVTKLPHQALCMAFVLGVDRLMANSPAHLSSWAFVRIKRLWLQKDFETEDRTGY